MGFRTVGRTADPDAMSMRQDPDSVHGRHFSTRAACPIGMEPAPLRDCSVVSGDDGARVDPRCAATARSLRGYASLTAFFSRSTSCF